MAGHYDTNPPRARESRRGTRSVVGGSKSEIVSEMPRVCADERAAVLLMERMRWAGTPCCPHCASVRVYKMRDRATGERSTRFLWRCRETECGRQYTWRIGTVAEESRIPARYWVLAYWRCGTSKKGISALELARQTGLTHKSALFLLHRIRWAMATDWSPKPRMSGTVEVDEMYVGGKPRGGGGSMHDKIPVVALLERGRGVRAMPVGRIVTADTIGAIFKEHVAKSATVYSDGAKYYPAPAALYASQHEWVNYDAKEYARGNRHDQPR